MILSPRQATTLAGLGSAAMLAGAYGFERIGGMPPCELCLWQRWPHAAAALVLVLLLLTRWRWLAWVGAAAALATAAIGLFHAGVEQGWWTFVSSCTSGGLSGLSGASLIDPTIAAPTPVRCDQIPWSMFGISMAGWNAVISIALTALWLYGTRRKA